MHRHFTENIILMRIPPSRSPIDFEVEAAVLATIDSRQYILGPECQAFEQEFAGYVGSKHAVLTSSATAALWMALEALGVKHDSEVLVPSRSGRGGRRDTGILPLADGVAGTPGKQVPALILNARGPGRLLSDARDR